MIFKLLAPDSRATCTYDRSRIVSTCARMVRVGHSQARAAITSAICSMVIAEWIEIATMISTRNVGMVRPTSTTPRTSASTQPP